MLSLKKTSWALVLVFFVFGGSAAAQVPDEGPTSIGFTAPDSTQPVRAYRLPTWHWSRWTLGGNGDVGWATRNTETQEESQVSTSFRLNPRYTGFWEGEERSAFLTAAPTVSVNTSRSTSESDDFGETENDRTNSLLAFDFQGQLREYVRGRTFVLADGAADLLFRRDHRGPENTVTNIDSDVDLNARLGVGVGRVRVVTPVIRALRVRERLREVAPGASLSDDRVQAAARQLARRPGYEAVYDRPDKVFWRDFFEDAGLADRSTFETFYVADVLREPVGVRREGREAQIGMLGLYGRSLERRERDGDLIERTLDDTKSLGAFARGQWYRNLTLRHQIGVDVRGEYTDFLNSSDRYEAKMIGQWLWVLADRVRLDTELHSSLTVIEGREEDYLTNQQHILSSDLLYFVENSLSLSAGGNLTYGNSEGLGGDSQSDWNLGLQFQVTYVLSRALR